MTGSMGNVIRYDIDIVVCVSLSKSMATHLDGVKEIVLRLVREIPIAIIKSNVQREVRQRARVVTFGDLGVNPEALQATDFFDVSPSADQSKFNEFLSIMSASGNSSQRQSALEALSVSVRSDWTHEGDRQRHIIVMFTDSGAHKLESRVGEVPSAFRDQVPASLDELTDRWHGNQAVRLKKSARRLLIFGPDAYPWNVICDAWGQTVLLPSPAGKGLEEVEFQTMVNTVRLAI